MCCCRKKWSKKTDNLRTVPGPAPESLHAYSVVSFSALPSLPLVNTFMGIWKLVDGKNFNDHLKSLRVDFATMTNLPHHWSEWRHNHHKNTQHLQEHRDQLQAGNGVWWDNSRWQKVKSTVMCCMEANLFTCRSRTDRRKAWCRKQLMGHPSWHPPRAAQFARTLTRKRQDLPTPSTALPPADSSLTQHQIASFSSSCILYKFSLIGGILLGSGGSSLDPVPFSLCMFLFFNYIQRVLWRQ